MALFENQKGKNQLHKLEPESDGLNEQQLSVDEQKMVNQQLLLDNNQLTAKNLELQKSINQLDSFSSIASHDLKEPLRKIMLFSNLVVEAEKDTISETSSKYLERIVVSANRLQQLIEDLIDYSRIGNEKIKFVKTDLAKPIKKAIAELKDVIEEKKAVVEVGEFMPSLPILASQMTQLFVNIIGNAIKYSKKDEIPKIKITAEIATSEELKPFYANLGVQYYKIVLADNGIGFSNEYKDSIFDAFKRLHGKDEYAGTGIGLAICKKIAGNHNGYITSESEVGKGSTFLIYLPEKQELS